MNEEMDRVNIFERCKRLVSWRTWSEAREEDMSHPISNQKFLAADCLQSKGADECGREVRGLRGWPLKRNTLVLIRGVGYTNERIFSQSLG